MKREELHTHTKKRTEEREKVRINTMQTSNRKKMFPVSLIFKVRIYGSKLHEHSGYVERILNLENFNAAQTTQRDYDLIC